MPSVNFSISRLGAVVDVQIGVSEPRRMALIQAQQPIPTPVACRLLIDTGASVTCVDSWIIQQLQLSPIGMVSIHTPSTTAHNAHACQQYDVSLIIPHRAMNGIFPAIPVIESSFTHQGIDGLLGRDILTRCLLVYNGELDAYTLSF